MIWSPDSSALFGPVPELRNYFCCNGIIPGFSQSGGLGLLSAEWIVEGEPKLDMFGWDLARSGRGRQGLHKGPRPRPICQPLQDPLPERGTRRGPPVRTRPIYETQKAMGAVFGLNYGWEHPLWFSAEGEPREETIGFDRQNWWGPVGREARALRDRAGSSTSRTSPATRITGPGARDWLEALLANRIPGVQGRSCLAPLIGKRGGIAGDFTVTCLGDGDYFMVGSGMAERYHKRFFDAVPLPAAPVGKRDRGDGGLQRGRSSGAGVVERLTNADLSNEAFPFLRSQQIEVAGFPASRCGSVSPAIWGGSCTAPRLIRRGFMGRSCRPGRTWAWGRSAAGR